MSKLFVKKIFNPEEEVHLDPSIRFDAPLTENATDPRQILITGATGYLGGYLLGDLLNATSAEVYCLVRGKDSTTAKERLIKNLQSYGRWQEAFSDRIQPVLGDLSQPRFGLDETAFSQLAGKLDTVYHNGGWVNNIRSYAALKPTNVTGTESAIRLATLHKMKPLHFVSSLAIFFSKTYAGAEVVHETDQPIYDPHIKSGYIQSKWVADRLVQQAQSRGLPASIYRPARVTADSQTGQTNAVKDLLSLLIKSCIYLKKYPVLDVTIPMVPVDYLSQAISHLSQKETSWGQAFHFINEEPLPWNSLAATLGKLGYDLEALEYSAWRRELKQQIDKEPANETLKLIQALLYAPNNLFFDRPRFDMSGVHTGLAGTSVVWPPIDERLVSTYISYFQQIGFLPPIEKN